MESEELSTDQERKTVANHTTEVVKPCRYKSLFKWMTIELLVFAVILADSISSPIVTNLILTKTCEVHFHYNKTVCSTIGNTNKTEGDVESIVQPYADVILSGMNFLSILMPAFMSMFLGPWSDKNGRKFLLIGPSIGYFLKFFLLGVFSYFPNLNPAFGLAAVIPVSLSGGMIAFISASYSYVTDITTVENHYFRISVLECFMYIGSILGLLTVTPLFRAGGSYGYLLIFSVNCSIILVAVIFTHFFVPESVQALEDGKGILHIFDLKLLKEMVKVCFKKREGHTRTVLMLVIFTLTATIACMEGESNVLFLFTRLKFQWNISEFGVWSSVTLAYGFFGLLLGAIIFSKWLKLPDPYPGLISYSLKAVSSFYLAFIPSTAPYLMYYVGLINMFGGLCGPAGRAVMSNSVQNEDIGKVFALTGSSESIFPLVIAPLYTWLYNSTIDTLPSAFCLVTGCTFALCAVFYIIILFIYKPRNEVDYSVMENDNEEEQLVQ